MGVALDALEAEGANPVALAAFRALALSGCRRGEILSLKRDHIDAHRQVLRLPDSKTGQQLRPIGDRVLTVLRQVSAEQGNYHVFPATRGDGPLVGVKLLNRVIERAGLTEVNVHTLRHAYASMALELGYSELTIAGLLGHRLHSVTSRYAHHVDRSLVSAADRVSAQIDAAMRGDTDQTDDVVGTNVVKLQA